jgi:anti-sigma factor (TIGR02949 family)
LYDIIDKEASEIDVKQVEEHLEKCGDCFEKYRLETEIQNFLGEKFRKANAEAARDALKARILDQLDDVDHTGTTAKGRENQRPFRFAATIMVAAASIVVLIGAGLFGARLYSHQTRFIPLEKSHWSMTASLSDATLQTPADLFVTDAQSRFGYDLQPAIGSYRLVSGRLETLLGTELLHYVYAAEGSTVSVFLAPDDFMTKVGDDRLEKVVHNQIHFLDHNCRGCRVVFHQVGRTVVITASSDRSVNLLEFVPGRTII